MEAPALHPNPLPPILFRKATTFNRRNLQKSRVHYPKNLKTIYKPLFDQGTQSKKFVKSSAKLFQTQDTISSTGYSLNEKLPFQNIHFPSKMKSKSASLSSFKLEASEDALHPGSKTFFKGLSSLKNIRDFEVSFVCYRFNFTISHLNLLFGRLLWLNKLTHLTLLFRSCNGFGEIPLKSLCSFLAQASQLQSLDLRFILTFDDTNHLIKSLIPSLSKHKTLTKLRLLIDNGPYETQVKPLQRVTLTKLFMALGTMKALTDLTFSPNLAQAGSGKNKTEPLAECLQYLHAPSIKRLHFQTCRNIITKHIVEISQALRKFTSLESLCLDLGGSQDLEDESLAHLNSTFNELKCLTSLSLSFSLLTQNFALALKPVPNLESLKLTFQNPQLPDRQVLELFSNLKALKSSLKSLEIHFAEKSSLLDVMTIHFANTLKNLDLLKHLSLRVRFPPKIASRGIETLSLAIQSLSNLSSLSLSFEELKEVDEKAVDALSQALQSLPSLHTLYLDFTKSWEVDFAEASFQSFLLSLCAMKETCELTLRLPHYLYFVQQASKLKQQLNFHTSTHNITVWK